jgi:hypothetical protein
MKKFNQLKHGAVFTYGKYKMRFLRIEDVEDCSKQKWNAVQINSGVLFNIPKNATVETR